ncbi:Metallo-dependent phosphatase-like protein [Aspergillus keveii]|uniref:Metallo-dependent phosphatase-like protein n=1 Tax=Aspergillus keveii TaxID=714993 RepID=A0ABR4GR04_9EURO
MLQRLQSTFNRPSASFQVLSDLHLEINQQYPSFDIPVCAEYLILAGDIGRLVDYDNYRSFLQRQTERFELVFLILGNHEFYEDTLAAGLQKARRLEQEPCLKKRLILLYRGRYDIPGSCVTIIGCTLWSEVPDEARDIVRSKIQDFKKIQDWMVDDHNESHRTDLSWLLRELESIQFKNKTENKKRTVLVVTHHAPSTQATSSPQHANSPWGSAFGTDILSQVSNPSGVKAWIFGHTHYTTDFKDRGIRVIANQRGYVLPWTDPKGSKDRGFDDRKVIYL